MWHHPDLRARTPQEGADEWLPGGYHVTIGGTTLVPWGGPPRDGADGWLPGGGYHVTIGGTTLVPWGGPPRDGAEGQMSGSRGGTMSPYLLVPRGSTPPVFTSGLGADIG